MAARSNPKPDETAEEATAGKPLRNDLRYGGNSTFAERAKARLARDKRVSKADAKDAEEGADK
jgi:hypothetical protein